ncbi:MAG TPA: helix-turn-helix transcriptional regulator [Allosphingosinicella sp.]|nr:helix-turn-helix transcriptional regulator [Allosphingosinicella sp.]
MDRDRLDRLTDQQRACLRMVFQHMTSKEIAPRLGIEPGSVDQHIKAAMRTLGVGERRVAARILAQHEAGGEQRADSDRVLAMHEEQAGFDTTSTRPLPAKFQPPLPIWGGKPSDLGPLRRLAWIFAIMLMVALSFGVFLAGLEALSRVGRH